ncbi:putative signal transducing protein [Gudongella sp. SC589]|jgi:hypothetical protein|uniref:putative signal transducing protein n=1 Tax=Gudongella sp. SC589 TaxID=3385990 RepID=UPI003904996C
MTDNVDLVVLRTVENEFEMNMITAILEDNKIPFIVKNKGSGSYMRILTGSSPFLTHILIDSRDLERSIELISPIVGEDLE